jgi:uncharacterized membrane protein YfcA
MSATSGNTKSLRSSFFITMVGVTLSYLAHDLSGSHFLPRKWLVGWYAFSGLIAINIVLFIVTLFRSMWEARSISRHAPEDEKERLVEEVMVPALQGRAEPPEAASSGLEVPIGIAAGLLSGAVMAGAVLLVLRWTGLHP